MFESVHVSQKEPNTQDGWKNVCLVFIYLFIAELNIRATVVYKSPHNASGLSCYHCSACLVICKMQLFLKDLKRLLAQWLEMYLLIIKSDISAVSYCFYSQREASLTSGSGFYSRFHHSHYLKNERRATVLVINIKYIST